MAFRPFRPGAIKEALIPETTETINLGSNAKKWLLGFILTLTVATLVVTGGITIEQGMNVSGNVNITGNITQPANYYHCFNTTCGKYIYDNGSALIIKVN